MTDKKGIGIVGAGGYAAGELLRILAGHDRVGLTYVASESSEGSSVCKLHPRLSGIVDFKVKKYEPQGIAKSCELVFLAKPEPSSFKFARELFQEGLRIIDLAASFRFPEKETFESWYESKHECPELLSESVYGLPELYSAEIMGARIVGNPGCYATAVILGLAPLIRENLIESEGIIANCVSGFSGAGRSKEGKRNLASSVVDNVMPYSMSKHPHTAEIEMVLSNISSGGLKGHAMQSGDKKRLGAGLRVTFVPHVAGFERGIISTIYAKIKNGEDTVRSAGEILKSYSDFYAEKSFVRLYNNAGDVEIKNVLYSNFCDIGVEVNKRTGIAIIVTALDNLVKGASGQAVQNMNIMLGFDEREGLRVL